MDRSLRVMHLIARMNVGGPAILVFDLMQKIDTSKFEQVLVTGYCSENEIDYLDEVSQDINVIRILGLGRSLSIMRDLSAFINLTREIRKFNPDIIHTHTAKAGVLGRLAGLLAKPSAQRVHTYHGHLLHGYFGKGKTRLVIVIERLLGWLSHSLISIGTRVMQDLLDAGIGTKSKFQVIFPGLKELVGLPKEQARLTNNLDPAKIYLVFVGRLTQIKRPDRLIEIASQLKLNYPGVHMLVVGGGELLESTKSFAESNTLPMTFFGWRKDIGGILSASDIAILCSDNEGVPLALIQAAQAGLPILSTNVGSVEEIVKNGINGILVGNSTEDLMHGLEILIADEDIRAKYGEAGKKRAHELFSSKSMIEAHERLYDSLLS